MAEVLIETRIQNDEMRCEIEIKSVSVNFLVRGQAAFVISLKSLSRLHR